MESPTCSNSKSLVSAIHDKYDDDTPVEDSFCQIYVSSSAPGHVEGQLRLPKSLGMEQFGITCAGNPEDLRKLSADVEELDLADNLLSNWDEVFLILDSLHKLTFLNLTRNPLSQLNSAPNARYSTLKKLALNFTNLTWETIQNLLTVLPNLEELYLSGNSYDTINLNMPAYESLRLLQLNENKFEEWSCVLKIDKVFPKLRTLILTHNKISTCGSVEENESLLSHLKVLNMNNTQIAEWNELDKLSVFKSLSDIRLASIPIIKDINDRRKIMQLLSVHFPHLHLVNGTSLASQELKNAETVYLRHFEHLELKPLRYSELLAKHGPLQELADISLEPPFSVALTVEHGDSSQVIDVPTKQKISDLKKTLAQIVGFKNFRLFYEHKGCTKKQIFSYSGSRMVYSFCLEDGDKLICFK